MATENEVIERAQHDARRYRLSQDDAHELLVAAWHKWQGATNKDMPPGVYVHYGWKEWKTGSWIGGTNKSGQDVFRRFTRDSFEYAFWHASAGANPASVVAHRDWCEWIATQLSERSREVFILLAKGYRGESFLARRLGVCKRTYRRWLYHLRDELAELV